MERNIHESPKEIDRTGNSITLRGEKSSVMTAEKEIRDFFENKQVEKTILLSVPTALVRFIKNYFNEECKDIEKNLQRQGYDVSLEINEKSGIVFEGNKKGLEKVRVMLSKLVLEKIERTEVSFTGSSSQLIDSFYGNVYIKGLESKNHVAIHVSAESKPDWRKYGVSFDKRNFQTKEGLTVSWKYGSIAQEEADILVNSANSDLNHATACGKDLVDVGGQEFVSACKRHTNILPGDIAYTVGGKLRCNYVIHAVCTNWEPSKEEASKEVFKFLLQKILHQSCSLGATSLVMPYIGTGKHKFPKQVVSELFEDEIRRFSEAKPSSTLEDIRIIDFKEQKSKATKPGKLFSSLRHSKATACSIEFHNNVSVYLHNADITEYSVDALINLRSNDLLKGQCVSNIIQSKGDPKIQDELDGYSTSLPGSVIATSAGLMTNTQLILHVLISSTMQANKIQSSLESCFETAVSRGVRSVAIDLDDLSSSPELVVEAAQNISISSQKLQLHMFSTGDKTYEACKKLMQKKLVSRVCLPNNLGSLNYKTRKRKSTPKKRTDQPLTTFGPGKENTTNSVDVQIFACSQESIDETLEAIHNFISYNLVAEEIQMTDLSNEINKRSQDIATMAREHNVVIIFESRGVVSIQGRPQDVSNCKEKFVKKFGFDLAALQDASFPENWDEQPNEKGVHVVSLSPKSEEYHKVQTHTEKSGGPSQKVLSIYRIQNPSLYRAYCAKKASFHGAENEKQLFHGTKVDVLDTINANNFNRSFVKKGMKS